VAVAEVSPSLRTIQHVPLVLAWKTNNSRLSGRFSQRFLVHDSPIQTRVLVKTAVRKRAATGGVQLAIDLRAVFSVPRQQAILLLADHEYKAWHNMVARRTAKRARLAHALRVNRLGGARRGARPTPLAQAVDTERVVAAGKDAVATLRLGRVFEADTAIFAARQPALVRRAPQAAPLRLARVAWRVRWQRGEARGAAVLVLARGSAAAVAALEEDAVWTRTRLLRGRAYDARLARREAGCCRCERI
jgi:hypothetical protein